MCFKQLDGTECIKIKIGMNYMNMYLYWPRKIVLFLYDRKYTVSVLCCGYVVIINVVFKTNVIRL